MGPLRSSAYNAVVTTSTIRKILFCWNAFVLYTHTDETATTDSKHSVLEHAFAIQLPAIAHQHHLFNFLWYKVISLG